MKRIVDKYLSYFLIMLMAAITVDVLWGVFTRYAMGKQADWTEELARFLLIWIGMLGAAFATGQKMHLAIDLLSPSLGPKAQVRLAYFVHGLVAAFALTAMIAGGLRLMYITWVLGQTSPALGVPVALVYAAIPVAGALVVFYEIMAVYSKQKVTANTV